MAAPIIIDVEDDSDKENEAPEEVVTGHTASFEAIRSGETSRIYSKSIEIVCRRSSNEKRGARTQPSVR